MRAATERLRAQAGGARPLSVTTTHSFAALWLIPRLAGFTREHPGVDVRITADTRVQDLERDGLDLALRHGPASLAGPNAVRLFGEKVFPVCSPKLLKKKPLEKPADLRNHVLLQYDDPDVRHPWLHWKTWLEVERIADLQARGHAVVLRLRADHPGGGRRPRRRARPQPAGEGPARRGRAGRAVQEPGRPGARLLRHRLEARAAEPAGGRPTFVRRLARSARGSSLACRSRFTR